MGSPQLVIRHIGRLLFDPEVFGHRPGGNVVELDGLALTFCPRAVQSLVEVGRVLDDDVFMDIESHVPDLERDYLREVASRWSVQSTPHASRYLAC